MVVALETTVLAVCDGAAVCRGLRELHETVWIGCLNCSSTFHGRKADKDNDLDGDGDSAQSATSNKVAVLY